MAHNDFTQPVQVLKSLFPDKELQKLAEATGVVKRRRKIDIAPLFWTLVLGFGAGAIRQLSGLRRIYSLETMIQIASSSFHDRFTHQLVRFLKTCVAQAIARTNSFQGELSNQLSRFSDVMVADATVLRLHRFLQTKYPATRTNHTQAAGKLHMVMSLGSGQPTSVRLTGERCSEQRMMRIGPWVRGRLLLMDLGYFRYQLFHRIDSNGGFFISRLKKGVKPTITALHRVHRGRPVELVGKNLQEVLPRLKRKELDVEVEVSFYKRKYKGNRHLHTRRFRMVGILWEGEYRMYLTNIPSGEILAADIARIYRCRWEIELLFKELKSHYRLHELKSSKEQVVEALIYTALLTMIASRTLHRALLMRESLSPREVPALRWTAVFSILAPHLLSEITREYRTKEGENSLWQYIKYISIDPNRSRTLNCDLWGNCNY